MANRLSHISLSGIILLMVSQTIFSQTFTEQPVILPGVRYGGVAWGDYDNNGLLDLLLTGNGYAQIWVYDGVSTFTDIGAGLSGVSQGSAAWGDYDNDGDPDILLTGYAATIYRNDAGFFTDIGAGLTPIYRGSAAWGDYDSDGDLDIAIIGYSSISGNPIAKIYRNDGLDTFTEQTDISLIPAYRSMVRWGDYDADGDPDLLLCGYNNQIGYITKIYDNENGIFTDTGADLEGVYIGSAEWGDYDNDGDLDVLLTGSSSVGYISRVYRNDAGTFTDIEAGLTGVYYSSAVWGDADSDGDLDILLTGYTSTEYISKIYKNVSGTFSDMSAGLPGVYMGGVAWCDYDNDGAMDFILTGYNDPAGDISKIYHNDGDSTNSVPGAPSNLEGILGQNAVTLTWDKSTDTKTPQNGLSYNLYIGSLPGAVDVKSPNASLIDGSRKIAMQGDVKGNAYSIRWLQAGTYYWSVQAVDHSFAGSLFAPVGSFTVINSSYITPVSQQTIAVGQDGTDLTVTESGTFTSRQWKYSSVKGGPYDQSVAGATGITYTPNFSAPGTYYVVCESVLGGASYISNEVKLTVTYFIPGAILSGLNYSSAAWGDYDNNRYLDILVTGEGAGYQSLLYGNSLADFTEMGAGLTGVRSGSTSWGDYDNDGDLDILLTGYYYDGTEHYISNIYRNDAGIFNDISAGLTGVYQSSTDWGDYDNDGDLDILLAGYYYDGTEHYISVIYRNDAGVFNDISAGLTGVNQGSASWGDYDNDGDLDILLAGYSNITSYTSIIYRNDGGTFTDINAGLSELYNGIAAWGDYDSDGDLDILLSGYSSSGGITSIFRNDAGTFTDIDAGLEGLDNPSAAWGDCDNDGDLDILCSGYGSSGYVTRIYTNDSGVFTEMSTGLPGTGNSAVAWADFDNDGDLDIILSGSTGENSLTEVFINTLNSPNTPPDAPLNPDATPGSNKVTLSWDQSTDTETPADGLSYNLYIVNEGGDTIVSPHADITDGFRRVVRQGSLQGNSWTINRLPAGTYYWGVQAVDNSFAGSPFTAEESFIVAFSNSISPVADQVLQVNQDGSMLTVTESTTPTSRQWKYSDVSGGPYSNSITGATSVSYTPNFTDYGIYYVVCVSIYGGTEYITNEVKISLPRFDEQTGILIPGVVYGAAEWGDYDGNGELDFVLSGYTNSGYASFIYNNTGGVFVDIVPGLKPLQEGSVDWGDFDNDGDLDLLMTGHYYDNVAGRDSAISNIYRNDAGVFSNIGAGLTRVYNSSGTWGDYDNDGDLDILLTGYYSESGGYTISKIYRNDSNTFTDIDAGLPGIYDGSAEWGDYDNDGDLDILAVGYSFLYGYTSKIFRNDGNVFTDIEASLTGVITSSSASWFDYDSDGDLDVLLSGYSNSGPFSGIYRNDAGVFTDIAANLQGVQQGSAIWGDYDNDGDPDVLITGNTDEEFVSILYSNDAGIFSEVDAGLTGVRLSSAAWGDYDNDGDLDVLLTGQDNTGNYISKIYSNNAGDPNNAPGVPANLAAVVGSNQVTLTWDRSTDSETAPDGLSYNLYIGTTIGGSVDKRSPMADVTTGYRRVVSRGDIQSNSWTVKWLPAGDYYWSVQAVDHSFAGSDFAGEEIFTIAFSSMVSPAADQILVINQDGTGLSVTESSSPDSRQWKYSTISGGPYDQVITGSTGTTYVPNFSSYGTFYVVCESVKDAVAYTTNEVKVSVPAFSEQTGTGLENVYNGSASWGDYDSDEDLDLLLTGYSNTYGYYAEIYENSGGVFSDIDAGLAGVSNSFSEWGDYDSDGELDIVISGNSNSGRISTIYRNDGGTFTDIGAGLPGVSNGSTSWGDFDNDGDQDLLLTGHSDDTYISVIYRNDNGIFSDINAGLRGVDNSVSSWGDYDSDGDLDILLTGYSSSYGYSALVYRNDAGIFTDIAAGLTGISDGSSGWGDYDNDGDLDILMTGYSSSGRISKVYSNDAGVFTDITAGLIGLSDGASASWADFDNDGDIDILLSGNSDSGIISKFHRNDAGIFTDITDASTGYYIDATVSSSVAWGDYDKDSDLDIFISGNSNSGIISRIYNNYAEVLNDSPDAPPNLQETLASNKVTLSWDKASDAETAQDGLSYNLYLGTGMGEIDKISPMATLSDGYRSIVKRGDIQSNSWVIKWLPAGTYYWSVQAIDKSFAGSSFATEDNFTIAFSNSIAPVEEQTLEVNQDGTTLTVTESSAPTSRKWRYSTVSGGPYDQVITGATSPTYTPRFSDFGTYYVVCESTKDAVAYTSNEVKVVVPAFAELTGADLEPVSYSSTSWGDYNNDGDLDILLSGYSNSAGYITRIYDNNAGSFSDIVAGLTGVYYSSSAWGDYNNDGDLDILLTGTYYDGTDHYVSEVYMNDGGTFSEIGAGLQGVYNGSTAWGDYDNDGDLDILLTGQYYTDQWYYISNIYRNDSGIFTEIGAGLTGSANGSAEWGDYDNDGDLDILLSGYSNITGYLLKIYNNNGGSFTDIAAGLPGIVNSSVKWGDYDNDGDLDVLIAGYSNNWGPISRIYRNDSGVFTDIEAGFTGMDDAMADWVDFDNDGDLDVFISGYGGSEIISGLYRNDAGIFLDATDEPTGFYIPGAVNSSGTWGDYDNDGDLDFLISGSDNEGSLSRIYNNNAITANTVPAAPANLQEVFASNKVTLSWDKATDGETAQDGLSYNLYIGTASGFINKVSPMADISDGFRKIAVKGLVQDTSWIIRLLPADTYYWSVQATDNTLAGSEFAVESSFTIVFSSSIAPVDDQVLIANQDGTTLTVTESSTPSSRRWKYSDVSGGPYTNTITGATSVSYTPNFTSFGTYYVVCESTKDAVAYTSNEVKIIIPAFTEITGIIPEGFRYSASEWGDFDNDGDPDIVITGQSVSDSYDARIFRNDAGLFTDIGAAIEGVQYGSTAWGDYDNDNDLDLLLTGYYNDGSTDQFISKIYRNDGGTFTDIGAGLTGVYTGSSAWGDYDIDGDLDILLAGVYYDTETHYITKIYRNDTGIFNEISHGLPGADGGSVSWGDYDNDGDLDILLNGYNNNNGSFTEVYRNDNGIFIDLDSGLPGFSWGSAEWGDYDSDGDLDILLAGGGISRVYRNDDGIFTDIVAGLTGISDRGTAVWGDLDNDGDLDILLSGWTGSEYISKFYRNDAGAFTDITGNLTGYSVTGINYGSLALGDYNKDGDLDILLNGSSSLGRITKIYRNNLANSNTVPGAPANLQSSIAAGKVTLSWDKSSDTQTPQ
ncbi:MAG: VCBS repeat-containing protein, partial [Bacteroidota bacterium]